MRKKNVRTEKGEDVGVSLEIVGAHDLASDSADGGLDRALGLDSRDREGGDEWESTEDDERDECRGVHTRGDLGSPMVEDGFTVV